MRNDAFVSSRLRVRLAVRRRKNRSGSREGANGGEEALLGLLSRHDCVRFPLTWAAQVRPVVMGVDEGGDPFGPFTPRCGVHVAFVRAVVAVLRDERVDRQAPVGDAPQVVDYGGLCDIAVAGEAGPAECDVTRLLGRLENRPAVSESSVWASA